MKARRLIGVGLLLGVLTALGAPATAHADAPLRILITGDSLTHGRHLDFTWRYRLYREFQRQGRPVDFVGSRSTPYVDAGYSTSRYADPAFDQDHFAFAGSTLASMVPKIGAEVAAQRPDVVILEDGINDILQGAQPAAVDASLRSWVAEVRLAKPDTRIVLCTVLDQAKAGTAADTNARVRAYDVLMAATATELSSSTSPITVADTTRGWEPADHADSWDGLHPTPTGETLIADRVAQALDAAGELGPANLYHSVPWPRVSTTSVAFSGRTATVSWGTQATSSALMRWHRVGAPWVQTGPIAAGRRVFAVEPGAYYEFRVQMARGYMAGPWGPITRVRAATVKPAAPARVTVTRAGVRWSAVAGASRYVVQIRKAHRRRWVTRYTSALHVGVRHVAAARVQAVGPGGRSGWRRGVR